MSTRFDVELRSSGHLLRATGTTTPYVPAKGPTMEHAGGEPAEGGELEDVAIFLIHRRKGGGHSFRQLCEKTVEARDFDDEIREALADQWADENGPQD